MSNSYRLNVRFNLDNEAERRAAEYLADLGKSEGKSRNRFIVEAVISFIERGNNTHDFTLDDVREMFREELQEVSFAAPKQKEATEAAAELSDEQKAENDDNVLSDLAAFF